jgi:hypothetical protein
MIYATAVPTSVKQGFTRQYPGLTPRWEKEDGNYEASFHRNGRSMSVVMSPGGTILETETDIKVSELPTEALFYLKTHYKGHTIKEASKIEKRGGEINYEAMVKGSDVMFNVNGKYLREIKEAKD